MNIRNSIRRLSLLFIILFIAISGGLIYWQVVVAQQVTSNSIMTLGRSCLPDSTAKRGRIFDRNGVLLAESVPVVVKSNNPNAGNLCVYQRKYFYSSLAPLIGWYISPIVCSYSPYCSSGVEKQFNDYLTGTVGITGLNNTVNKVLHVPPVGDDIYLTIDVRAQNIVDKYFNEEAAHAPTDTSVFTTHTGSVIVTDPHTGEIIAMESQPTFDPNRIASGDVQYLQQVLSNPGQPYLNRAIDDCYVPGSTYKTLTLMAALDSGKMTLDSPFYNDKDPTHMQAIGPVRLGAGTDTESFGPVGNNIDYYTYNYPVTLNYGFSHSDNIIFAQVGANTGVNTWLSYNHAFYVNQQIPFDLPVKVSTVTSQSQKNLCRYTVPQETPLSVKQLAENSFGQGVDFVTPLQMSLFDDAAANNGQLMRPTLISKIVDPTQSVLRSFSPTVLGNPISQDTAIKLRDAMYGVVSCGSGSLSRVQLSYPYSPWSVIGKTGTGQVDSTGVTPAQSWFITAAPYQFQSGQLPRLTIVAMKEHGGEGAYANGPMLRDIYQALFTQVYNLTQPSVPDQAFCTNTGLIQPKP